MDLVIGQLPFAPAKMLDSVLKVSGPRIQKYRQEFRRSIGSSADGGSLSLGRLGTVQLEPTLIFPYLETRVRWERAIADELLEAFIDAGLGTIVRSREFKKVLNYTKTAFREKARDGVPPGRISRSAYEELLTDHSKAELVVHIATELNRVWEAADREKDAIATFVGQLVRFEGDSALIVINTGVRDELRQVPARMLQEGGITESGDLLIEQQFRWTEDATASIYLPGIVVSGKLNLDHSALEKELARAETLLPTPPVR